MNAVTELGYLKVGVSSLKDWRKFAAEVLAVEVVDDPDNPKRVYLRLDYWHHRVILEENGLDDLMVMGLRVRDTDAFGKIADVLRAKGISVKMGSLDEAMERHVLEFLTIEDPMGTTLEIFHGPHLLYDAPFHPGRRMHGGFKTGDGGLGHVMMAGNADLKVLHDFYRMLGMTGAIEYRVRLPGPPHVGELLFMRCNSRQHTLAFGAPHDKKRINHLLFEVQHMDDVSLAHNKAIELGETISVSLGRHANDQMYSFYCLNPSGFLSEIGWGARFAQPQSEYFSPDSYGHEPGEGVADASLKLTG